MSVIVENLTKIYGKQKAIKNISFSVREGEILGFLGPNGAGKSTTMKIATCFLPPTSGSVKVCGYDVLTQAMDVKKLVGYLPEHNPLYLDMYVHEYLQFIASIQGVPSSKRNNSVKEMIGLCGLEKEQNKKIGQLSKGYRQRVGLAQAMVHNPKVLILDEPTTGLDPNQLIEIRNLIKEIGKQKTVIFSTHIMQEGEQICSRVVIINQGEIVTDDEVKNLQQFRGAYIKIAVQLDKYLDPEIFKQINGVFQVDSAGDLKYVISCKPDHDIRTEIFNLISHQGVAILELKQEEDSLEKVFRQLTQNV